MRDRLRIELLRQFRTQSAASRALGISESRLSRILHGWENPNPAEKEKLAIIFSARRLPQLLKTEPGIRAAAL